MNLKLLDIIGDSLLSLGIELFFLKKAMLNDNYTIKIKKNKSKFQIAERI